MVSNELTKIAQLIKIQEGFSTMEQVAKAIGYKSRSHFSKELKKGTSEEIRDKMFAKYPNLFTAHNVRSSADRLPKPGSDVIMPVGNLKKTLADYVDLMERYNAVLEMKFLNVESEVSKVVSGIRNLESNLTPTLAGLESLSVRFEAAKNTVLESLSRVEGKPDNFLKDVADKRIRGDVPKAKK